MHKTQLQLKKGTQLRQLKRERTEGLPVPLLNPLSKLLSILVSTWSTSEIIGDHLPGQGLAETH